MFFKRLLNSIKQLKPIRGFTKVYKAEHALNAVNKPLLNQQEILDFNQELESLAVKWPTNPKQSNALRQGELSSRYMGSGMEYEESRPYQPGDEIRRFNWRLMAKTGQAYSKYFQEERQENWFILLDHRATMRFGTKTRLKATQATRVAGYYAWLAQQAGVPVSLGRMTDRLEQTPIYEGRSSFSQIMQKACEPCPPLKNVIQKQPAQIDLNDVLVDISHQLQAGARVMVISDFYDLDDKTCETLVAMQNTLLVKAVLITDSAEHNLPEIENLTLVSNQNAKNYPINPQQRAQFKQWALGYFEEIQQKLNSVGVQTYSLLAQDELKEIALNLSATGMQKATSGVKANAQNAVKKAAES